MYSIPPANLIIAGSLANFSDILYFSICHLPFDGKREYFWSFFYALDTGKFNTREWPAARGARHKVLRSHLLLTCDLGLHCGCRRVLLNAQNLLVLQGNDVLC